MTPDARRMFRRLTRRLPGGLALALTLALGLIALCLPQQAQAFCGFFVAKGDAKLFNDASKVVMARDGERTVLTMVNDFRGDVSDFAMVIPSPQVLERGQINVADNAVVDHLDAYTAPRLVEYFDPDPCGTLMMEQSFRSAAPAMDGFVGGAAARAEALGVTVEAEYLVGEYDILILSAEQSDGLVTWLNENGYTMPEGAEPILGSYIRQDMKFFVARVNLEEHAKQGGGVLRPLQIAYESEKFMLPIRLGTVNAEGSQDLILYTLTRKGRVETANYRTIAMPSGQDIPVMVKENFGETYKAIFAEAVRKEGGAAVMLEYAWDMAWCDPCAADPLSADELRTLGAFWVPRSNFDPSRRAPSRAGPRPGGPQQVYVTRLHARYDAESFPDDLRLIETANRENYQGRYVLRHPFTGELQCEAGKQYLRSLTDRFEREAQTLASLTGWNIGRIRDEMAGAGQDPGNPPKPRKWWETIWKD